MGAVLAFCAILALPAPAGAVLSGENGRIVFVRGPDAGGDAQAQLHLLPVPSSTGGGTVSPAITSFGAQHRHPTWSPDRTRIAYARGDVATRNFDIFIQDLTNPGSTPVNITNSNNVTDDRPAWSPDGTKIAYESEVTDGSGQRDVLIKNAPFGGAATNFTNTTAAGQFEGKPAWDPNSAVLFYEKNDPATQNANIVKKALNAGTETLAVADSSIDEYQPSISPDGTKVCFTISNNTFNGSAEVMVAPLTSPPSGGTVVSFDLTTDDYNCTWSPDGQLVAYVTGTLSAAQLVVVRGDDTSLSPIPLAQDPGANNFDGNPDWAPDARPVCPDSTATTRVNTPVTIPVACTDTGPAYERTNVREFKITNPANGTATQNSAGDPITYTPNPGFVGTDSFRIRSFDELGFGTDTGTVTINVQPAPGGGGGGGGNVINGTAGNDTLNGTPGNDVINCGDGDDVVNAGGGDDVINCGAGNDRVNAGAGNDRVDGASGNDLLSGNEGDDRIVGGSGNERANGNEGNDRVGGQSGNDRVGGQSGHDRVNGERGRDRVSGGSGNDRVGGQSGNDRVNGDSGRDRVNGGSGRDVLSGSTGNDAISARDRTRDRVNCGRGRDRVAADRRRGRDRVSRNCERVRRR